MCKMSKGVGGSRRRGQGDNKLREERGKEEARVMRHIIGFGAELKGLRSDAVQLSVGRTVF